MNAKTTANRCLEVLALAMIGEGVVGMLRPTRYARFWKMGPKPMRDLIEAFGEHPHTARVICAAEIGLGLWLALREIEK